MKKSEKFWNSIGILFLIALNIAWILYEKKYWNHRPSSKCGCGYTYLPGVSMFIIDLYWLTFFLLLLIPRFNAWLNDEKYDPNATEKEESGFVPLTEYQISLVDEIVKRDFGYMHPPVVQREIDHWCSMTEFTLNQQLKNKEIGYNLYSDRLILVKQLKETLNK